MKKSFFKWSVVDYAFNQNVKCTALSFMGDIADRLFGTDPEEATPILGDDGMDDR